MKETTKAIIEYRLKRAKECIEDANILFENGKLYSTVNRAYYAMFYSVNALILSKSLSSPKHSGVKALFNKEFVVKGLVNKESGRFYSRMLERRQKSDYKDLVEFNKEDVEDWFNQAKEFIKTIEKLTRKIIQEAK